MSADDRADRLAEIALELAIRIRDDDPEDVRDWLHSCTDADDRDALLYVQAAAGPVTSFAFKRAVRWASPPTDQTHIDEIAVERACHGDRVKLTAAERAAAIAKLERRGMSAHAIGETLRLTRRTVVRHRAKDGAA